MREFVHCAACALPWHAWAPCLGGREETRAMEALLRLPRGATPAWVCPRCRPRAPPPPMGETQVAHLPIRASLFRPTGLEEAPPRARPALRQAVAVARCPYGVLLTAPPVAPPRRVEEGAESAALGGEASEGACRWICRRGCVTSLGWAATTRRRLPLLLRLMRAFSAA